MTTATFNPNMLQTQVALSQLDRRDPDYMRKYMAILMGQNAVPSSPSPSMPGMPSMPPTGQSATPQQPPQQQGILGRIGGALGNVVQNPQFLEGIATLIASRGKLGGYRAQGMQEQFDKRNQMALQQQQLQQQTDWRNRQMTEMERKNKEEEEIARGEKAERKLSDVVKLVTDEQWTEITPEQLVSLGVTDPKEQKKVIAIVDKNLKKKSEKDYWIDFEGPKESWKFYRSSEGLDLNKPTLKKFNVDQDGDPADVLKKFGDILASEKTQAADTNDIKNYKFAQSQGYKKSFQQWLADQKKSDRPEVNLPQVPMPGVGMKPGDFNEAALKDATPAEIALVRKIVNYEYPIPTGGFAMNSPQWQRIIYLASSYDPTFDANQYAVRAAVRKSFTSGQDAKNLQSLNTVIGHLDTLKKSADELGNISIRGANALKNWLKTETGYKEVRRFETARDAVASELTRVFRGTGGAEADVQAWKSTVNSSDSPEQLNGAINLAIELIGSRAEALKNTYERGIGKPKDFRFLSDKARGILTELNADADVWDSVGGGIQTGQGSSGSNTVKMQTPDGKVWDVPVENEAEATRRGAKRIQ